eukprot:TRINITY_DN4200_c0_g1_i7.p1 TRINITY_DN4200_c0_g1~~TRINITY_DN4200_c0_g1_i7.p1  ORF type:complete len:880 (-),score=235.76 TRINITY_DN4200_c0_g1_i7:40-2679(-)
MARRETEALMVKRLAEDQARKEAEERIRRQEEISRKEAEDEIQKQLEEEMARREMAALMAKRLAEDQARKDAEDRIRRQEEISRKEAEEEIKKRLEEEIAIRRQTEETDMQERTEADERVKNMLEQKGKEQAEVEKRRHEGTCREEPQTARRRRLEEEHEAEAETRMQDELAGEETGDEKRRVLEEPQRAGTEVRRQEEMARKEAEHERQRRLAEAQQAEAKMRRQEEIIKKEQDRVTFKRSNARSLVEPEEEMSNEQEDDEIIITEEETFITEIDNSIFSSKQQAPGSVLDENEDSVSEDSDASKTSSSTSSSSDTNNMPSLHQISRRSSIRKSLSKQSGLFNIYEDRGRAVLVVRYLKACGLAGQSLRPYIQTTDAKGMHRRTDAKCSGISLEWAVDWILDLKTGKLDDQCIKFLVMSKNQFWHPSELGHVMVDQKSMEDQKAKPGRWHDLCLNLSDKAGKLIDGAHLELKLLWVDTASSPLEQLSCDKEKQENTTSTRSLRENSRDYCIDHDELMPQVQGSGLLLLRLPLPQGQAAKVELGSQCRSLRTGITKWFRKGFFKEGAGETHECVLDFEEDDNKLDISLQGKGDAHLYFRDLVPGRWSKAYSLPLVYGKSDSIKPSIFWIPRRNQEHDTSSDSKCGRLLGNLCFGTEAQLDVQDIKISMEDGRNILDFSVEPPTIRMRVGACERLFEGATLKDKDTDATSWWFGQPGKSRTTGFTVGEFNLRPGDCMLVMEVKGKPKSGRFGTFKGTRTLGTLSYCFRKEPEGVFTHQVKQKLEGCEGVQIQFQLSWQSPSQTRRDVSCTRRDAQTRGYEFDEYRNRVWNTLSDKDIVKETAEEEEEDVPEELAAACAGKLVNLEIDGQVYSGNMFPEPS